MMAKSKILFLAALAAWSPAARAEWRRLGNAALDLKLGGPATGPVEDTGYSRDGERVYAASALGGWLVSEDGEKWAAAADEPAPGFSATAERLPEDEARVIAGGRPGLLYAAANHVWRSEDNGRTWRNLTFWRGTSLLGGPVAGLAARPGMPEEITAAAATGLWRSTDGGLSWNSLNAGLPHLPVRRIVSLPKDAAGLRVALLAPASMTPAVFEWAPGEKNAWQTVPAALSVEQSARLALSRTFQVSITALLAVNDFVYAGSSDGRIFVSSDRGTTWIGPAANPGAAVEAFAADPQDPRRAVVALRRESAGPVVMHTSNGGLFWDNVTSNLGASAVYGIDADFRAGAIYAATAAGVFWTPAALSSIGPATNWRLLESKLPEAPVFDVKLDANGQTLFAALYGHGVFFHAAPHRQPAPKIVSAADWSERPAAPGALLSILGAKLTGVRAGGRRAALLSSAGAETQIQLPFDLDGNSVTLALESEQGTVPAVLPLQPAAPAILVDRDGTAMLVDSATGAMIDGNNPARAGTLLQILASGLGRVRPDWPAGMAAPVNTEQLPAVVADVRAWLDGSPVEVVRATLAPGYTGYYLVEVRLPETVNSGPAELYLNAGNSSTNRVRLYIEQ